MFKKTLLIVLLWIIPTHATVYTCINQNGFDVGIGNTTIGLVIKGNFSFISMDNNYKAFSVSVGPNIEYQVIAIPHFKMYAMTGAFYKYGNFSPGYTNAQGNSVTRQETLYGFNVLAVRPEAVISPRVSLYSNITFVKYESSSEAGDNIWIFSFLSSSVLDYKDAVPEIGIKIYF